MLTFTGQTNYAVVTYEERVNYIQKLSFPWDACKLISCGEKKEGH
ncbi:hypothetical protein [Lentiprolixibacter aurantiacus]|uniref:Uncharacterized protein n=1 Tax=Lentiprolixibacter aurantiacus TaxID=2993939 RepID=A0AAE3MMS8_9FLAO|nr:hypothetical protein [Lentiprolixibacter aurantiacus]MCX2719754.1 hypothetical protein [Lentiprolixibacter aurantiacus]